MPFYQFTQTQKIPVSKQELWLFVSNPANLKHITPPEMGFDIISQMASDKMYAGMIISYIVKPLLGIPLTWVTEITNVVEQSYFVDEQRIGPYALWHHQHKLEEIPGGVLMTDIISYQPPLGLFGALANALFIRKQLQKIFAYRTQALVKIFGNFNP